MFKFVFRVAYIASVLIEALVMTRIVLTIINANPSNTFASWVFNLSGFFIQPFSGLTANTLQIDRFSLPLTPIIALLFYMIAVFILSELVKSFSKE